MIFKTRTWLVLTCFCFSFALIGCGGGDEGPERYHLSGTVTYDGKPIPQGMIKFTPAKGTKGPQGNAQIVDGKYNTQEQGGSGVVGGAYKITVSGFDGKADPDKELPMGQPLFREYQFDHQLPAMPDNTDKPVNQDFKVPKQQGTGAPRRGGPEPA